MSLVRGGEDLLLEEEMVRNRPYPWALVRSCHTPRPGNNKATTTWGPQPGTADLLFILNLAIAQN